MKYKFYCYVHGEDARVIDFLKARNVKYEIAPLPLGVYFTIYSDTEGCDELLKYIKTLPRKSIAKSSVFSKQEMEEANWYLMYATRMGIDTSNVDYTFEAKCPYITIYGMKKHFHLEQINPFVSKRTPGWKNGYQFCSPETGFMSYIFCSDFAKESIKNSGIVGVEFMKVLKGDLKTETPDVSQLVFNNKLPLEAYSFVGDYEEEVCPCCGKVKYAFKEPNCEHIKLNVDLIPKGIDAFGSQIGIGYGFAEEPIVISKKFYNLITKELKEKPKHFIFYPIG